MTKQTKNENPEGDAAMPEPDKILHGKSADSSSKDSQDKPNSLNNRTKTCPYCMEAVSQEATKCSHCGSEFFDTPSQIRRAFDRSNAKVVYVLDRDVVRFGKFSLSILAIFTLIGVYLFGVDLKQTRKEIEAEAERVEAAQKEFDREKKELEVSIAEIRAYAERAESALEAILDTQNKTKTIYTQLIQQRDGILKVKTKTIVADSSTSFVAKGRGKLWDPGSTLHVRFFGGTTEEHASVETWARQWTNFANIAFVFDNSDDADIRIGFEKNDGSWSYVGTDSRKFADLSDRSMNLAWIDEATVLSQFGHALGLINEHQNPSHNIPWDEEAIYENYSGSPNNWPRETIERNILQKAPEDAYPIPKPFDSSSIMMFTFPDELTKGNFPLPGGKVLSDGDKLFIAKLYPNE